MTFKINDQVLVRNTNSEYDGHFLTIKMLHQEGGYLLMDSNEDAVVSVDEKHMVLMNPEQILQFFGLTEEEVAATKKLAEKHELTLVQIIRQSLRLYQARDAGIITCESTEPPVGCGIVL